MSGRWAVANAVARFFEAVDGCAWEAVEGAMAAPIHVDYSSFGAGPGADRSPAEVVAGWRALLPGFDHTHHQLGALEVTLEPGSTRAEVRSCVTATHLLDGASWTVLGRYVIGLEAGESGWAIARLRFDFVHQYGDTELPQRAGERAVKG